MSKPEMARPVSGPKRRRFPWLALVLLLGSAYAFWVLPWQLNGQKKFFGPEAAPEVKTTYANSAQPPSDSTAADPDKPESQNEKPPASHRPQQSPPPQTQP